MQFAGLGVNPQGEEQRLLPALLERELELELELKLGPAPASEAEVLVTVVAAVELFGDVSGGDFVSCQWESGGAESDPNRAYSTWKRHLVVSVCTIGRRWCGRDSIA